MPKGLRLMNDWILIQLDEDTNILPSGLIKPDGAYDTVLKTGKVMQVGPGRWAEKDECPLNVRIPVGVEVGDGVVFNRFVATKTETAKAVRQAALSENEALIRPSDVMLIFDHKNKPRFV